MRERRPREARVGGVGGTRAGADVDVEGGRGAGGARARESLDESTNEDKDKTERKETQENKFNVKT